MTNNNFKRMLGSGARAGVLPLAGLLLAACGGGSVSGTGSDDDGSVPLSSESDVLREVSLLSGAVSAINTLSSAIGGSGFAATSASSQPGLMRVPASKAQSTEAAVADSPCTDGGTDTQTSGTKTHSFIYFGNLPAPVAYQVDTFTACKRTQTDASTGASYQVTLDGVAEAGGTLVAVSGADYRYLIAGTGSTPLQAAIATGPALLTLKVLGTEEFKSTDSRVTVGGVLTLDYTASAGSTNSSGEIDLGTGSTPFYVGSSQTAPATSLDGPYAYHTTKCDGGSATAATTADLTSASDDQGSYINGGTLKLSTTSAAVTVVFNNDGSASYTFQSGSSGTLSRDELDNAIQNNSCGF
ncbi:MAG: hypothetical protein JWQ90_2725 [Hydrocarboniphaga sp.]|uniref:hypothetical protein n=1 Tax=Hydrocarboniphaga sp. TaxID=2033016 RepID=UPI0026361008|nr:hypothetical protein [Hydrocarboniphaga sp.]MDB5970275.1 hypothetical protein [Hydrocarboniphaga sp.]